MRYSACIEWLFAAEAPDVGDRVRLAHKAGLDGVEFWFASDKDVDAIAAALEETGMPLAGFVAEPKVPFTDRSRHGEFLDGVKRLIDLARRLKAPVLIVQAGPELTDRSREDQRDALVAGLAKAADAFKGSGVVLAVEPLNTRIDHVGYFLPSTVEALDIVDEIGRSEVRILYDIYHSAVMDEKIEDVLAGRLDRVAHVHLADAPGRHEPGNGTMDWQRRVAWLEVNGYRGMIGLEYRPTGPTVDSLRAVLAK